MSAARRLARPPFLGLAGVARNVHTRFSCTEPRLLSALSVVKRSALHQGPSREEGCPTPWLKTFSCCHMVNHRTPSGWMLNKRAASAATRKPLGAERSRPSLHNGLGCEQNHCAHLRWKMTSGQRRPSGFRADGRTASLAPMHPASRHCLPTASTHDRFRNPVQPVETGKRQLSSSPQAQRATLRDAT